LYQYNDEIPMSDTTLSSAPVKAPRRVREVPAVTRSIAVLRLLGKSQSPLGVKAIADTLGLVTSTCLHILRVLVDEGLVRMDPGTKRYSLGVGMLALARSVMERNVFPQLAQPVLNRLSTRWDITTIGVEIVELDHMIVLAISRSEAPFRLHVDIGSRFPALISATGRLVAAHTQRPWSEVVRRFKALRWHRAPDVDAWRKDVEKVRRTGYSIDRGNYIGGVTLIAVPVFGADRLLTHCLIGAGVSDQLTGARSELMVADMAAEARSLEEVLR
jgi:DNA-binding IclR family transcriptional regulator